MGDRDRYWSRDGSGAILIHGYGFEFIDATGNILPDHGIRALGLNTQETAPSVETYIANRAVRILCVCRDGNRRMNFEIIAVFRGCHAYFWGLVGDRKNDTGGGTGSENVRCAGNYRVLFTGRDIAPGNAEWAVGENTQLTSITIDHDFCNRVIRIRGSAFDFNISRKGEYGMTGGCEQCHQRRSIRDHNFDWRVASWKNVTG
jgi:hypothetical protein